IFLFFYGPLGVLRTEKNPGNTHRIDGNRPSEPAHRPRGPLESLGKARPLAMNEERGSVQPAPDNERPCSPVPQAAEQHRDYDIPICKSARAAISPKWNIEVIAQPAGETDVPAAPEIRDIPGKVWKLE